MKLNSKQIHFKPDNYKECEYCGICSFEHIHPVATLPKDYIVASTAPKDSVSEATQKQPFKVGEMVGVSYSHNPGGFKTYGQVYSKPMQKEDQPMHVPTTFNKHDFKEEYEKNNTSPEEWKAGDILGRKNGNNTVKVLAIYGTSVWLSHENDYKTACLSLSSIDRAKSNGWNLTANNNSGKALYEADRKDMANESV